MHKLCQTVNMENQILAMGKKAKQAAKKLAIALPEQKTKALLSAAEAVRENAKLIIKANEQDVQAAKKKDKTPLLLID